MAIVYRDDIDTVCTSCAERGITADCLEEVTRNRSLSVPRKSSAFARAVCHVLSDAPDPRAALG